MSFPEHQLAQSELLKVAAYLGRPQHFVTVADARSELKRTLELAGQSSVVLTTNGEPSAAIVPFTTLEAIRSAVVQMLVLEMEASLRRTQSRLSGEPGAEPTSEEELESLVRESLREERRKKARSRTAKARRR
jgi:antitoxin (DNA-binding transcriptional repressor) of toxin-antitoxin stability system